MPRSPARTAPNSPRRRATPCASNYVRCGQVSWEYRPYMIFPTDPGIFLLLRCQGRSAFFRVDRAALCRPGRTGSAAPGAAAGAAASSSKACRRRRARRTGPRRRARPVLPPARHARSADRTACLADSAGSAAARRRSPHRGNRGRRHRHADLLRQRREGRTSDWLDAARAAAARRAIGG